MKTFLSIVILLTAAGLFGMLIFLNQTRVNFVITPPIGGSFYVLPEMPLGLLVLFSFISGLVAGYLLALISKLFRGI